MIKSIYLENWKTHLDSKLSFQKGTNILLGVIGSGKSSVVDAICYALYGTFPTLSNRKISLDETIMFKPVQKESFKVILELLQEDKLYLIEREVFSGNKSNSAKVYLEGKLMAGPKKSDVDEFISKLLGIDYNLFIKVVYSQQNEIDYFLKIAPSKRKEQFDDLFGISHFENIKVSTREIDRLLNHEIDKNELLLKQITNQISNYNLEELLEKEKETDEKITSLEKEILEKEEKTSSLSKVIFEKKMLKEKHESLTSQISLFTSRLEDFNKEYTSLLEKTTLSSKEELDIFEKEVFEKEKYFKEKQNKNKETEILKKSLENKISFYENNISQNQERIKELLLKIEKEELTIPLIEEKKKSLLEEIDSLNILKISLLSKQKDLEKSFYEISKGFSNCPVCQTPFTADKLTETKEHVDKELSSLSLNLKDSLEKIKEKEEQLNLLKIKEKTLEKNSLIEKQIEQLNKILLENTSLKEKALNEINSLDKIEDLSSLEKEILKIKETLFLKKELLKISEKIKELSAKLVLQKEELSKINFSQEEYLNLLTDYKGLENNFLQIKESLTNYKSLKETLKKQLDNYSVLSKQKEEVNLSFTKINRKKQDLSYFLKAIDNSQLQLRKVLIDNINQALSIIWPKVYPYKDYLSARLNADNDYILEVLTLKNNWIRVEGLLSGGERACASLSIRIAISLILTKKLGLLILDEPTHNLDEKSIEALSNVLEEELPDLVEQIFIVTHDNKLLETVNATKFIIERDKENDSASRVNF